MAAVRLCGILEEGMRGDGDRRRALFANGPRFTAEL